MSRGHLRNAEMFHGGSTELTCKFNDSFGPNCGDSSDIEESYRDSCGSIPSSPESFLASSLITLDLSGNDSVIGHGTTEQTTRGRGQATEILNNPSSVLDESPSTISQRLDRRVSGNLNATITKLKQLQVGRKGDHNASHTDEDTAVRVGQKKESFGSKSGLGLTLSIINHNNSLASGAKMVQPDGQKMQFDLPAIGVTCSSPTQWSIQGNGKLSLSPSSLSPGSLTPSLSLSRGSSPIDLRLTASSRSDSEDAHSPLPPLKGTPKKGRKTLPPIRSSCVSPIHLPSPPKHSKLGNRALVPPIDFKSSLDVNYSQEDTARADSSHLTNSRSSYLEHSHNHGSLSYHELHDVASPTFPEQRIHLNSKSDTVPNTRSVYRADSHEGESPRFFCNHEDRHFQFDAVTDDHDRRSDDCAKREVCFEYSRKYRDHRPVNTDLMTLPDNRDPRLNLVRNHFTEICDKRDSVFASIRPERDPHFSSLPDKNVRCFSNAGEDRRSLYECSRSQRMSHPQHESGIQLSVHHYVPKRSLSLEDNDSMEIHAHFHHDTSRAHPPYFPDLRKKDPSFRRESVRDPCSKCLPADKAHPLVIIRRRRNSQSDRSRNDSHCKGGRYQRILTPVHDDDKLHNNPAPLYMWSRDKVRYSSAAQFQPEIGINDNTKTEGNVVKVPVANRRRSSSLCRNSRISVHSIDQRLDKKCDAPRERRHRVSMTRSWSTSSSSSSSSQDGPVTVKTFDRSSGATERRQRKSAVANVEFVDERRLGQGRVLLPSIRPSLQSSPINSATNIEEHARLFRMRRKKSSS